MPSAALTFWKLDRAIRLNRLLAAHKHVRVTNSGRRWITDELNHALILRLASEFQGFARELHDDSSNAVVTSLARGSTSLRNSLISPYLSGRRLDRGNADPDALDHDYRMLGLDLWRELDHRYPHRCTKWRQHLRLLNTARNGLAHDDEQRIQQVITSGWLLTLPFIHRWRIALDGLATGMDHVTGQYIHHTLGVQPW